MAEEDTKPKPTTEEGAGNPPLATQTAEDSGRRRRGRTDLTTGSIPKKLFAQAWPQSVEGILNILDQFVDLFWASRLPSGFRAIAGVGIAQTFTQFGMFARQGLDEAMSAMVARAVGGKNIALANHVVFQALLLTLVYSVLMTLVGFFLTDFFLNILGTTKETHAQTALYMQIQFVGMATQNLRMFSGRALQSAGDVIIPLRATFIARVLHIMLTPFLIFGWGFFPEMGLPGSSLANVLAQGVGFGMNLWGLSSGQSRLHLGIRGNRVDFPLIGRMLKIAGPASIRGTERASSQIALLGVAAPFGDVALAAYSLAKRVENFTSFGSMGIGQAAGVMVGQNLGANQPDRAKKAIWWACAFSFGMNFIIRGLFLAFPLGIVMVFTTDMDVVDLTVQWVRLQLIGSVFMGLQNIFQSSFNGAGDTLAPMIVTLVGVWFIEVPASIYLSHTALGPLGLGVGNILGMSSRLVFYLPYYFTGRWLRVKVI